MKAMKAGAVVLLGLVLAVPWTRTSQVMGEHGRRVVATSVVCREDWLRGNVG